MKSIKILRVTFDDKIKMSEIPSFRGAVIEKVGRESLLFHNHQGDGFRYSYPLIQYKQFGGHAAIVCLGEGVIEIHALFNQEDWSLQTHSRALSMQMRTMRMEDALLLVSENELFEYEIWNWLALNQESFLPYQSLETEAEKKDFLRKKLVGNILSFAKGVDWHIDKPIEMEILQFEDGNRMGVKGIKAVGFKLRFRTNVALPNGIGLGKNVSLGFGTITRFSV
jgi:hypothetical protein